MIVYARLNGAGKSDLHDILNGTVKVVTDPDRVR
jgi:hypothetical protein